MAARKKAAAKNSSALIIGGGNAPALASEAGAALMAKYREAVSTVAASTVAASGLPWISGRGGSFKCGDQQFGSELEVVVVDWFYENRYYEGTFDPDSPRNPVCHALSRDQGSMVAPEPAQAATCESCGWNVFGTDPVRGKAKACKQTIRLAITPATFIKDGVSLTDLPIYLLGVPVVSVKRWSQYMKTLRGFLGDFAPIGAYTRIKATTENNLSLFFEPEGGLVPFEAAQALQKVVLDSEKDIWQPPARDTGDEEKPEKPVRGGARKGARKGARRVVGA